MRWQSLLVTLALVTCCAAQDDYCLARDYYPYLRFGSKTAYEFVKGTPNHQHEIPNCNAVQMWSLNRHGTRLPNVEDILALQTLTNIRNGIIDNYEVKRTAPDHGRLCDQDVNNLRNWQWNRNVTPAVANRLTYQGADDMRLLAKRWQSRFQQLISNIYNPRDFEFRYTDEERTRSSFEAFAEGLFGRDVLPSVRPQPTRQNDTVLRPYKFCEAWIREVERSPFTLEQLRVFKTKQEWKELISNVSQHLGYHYPLDENSVQLMYNMCRYDKAWEINKNSPWCAAFTKEQLQLLEYAEDLESYYKSGYGSILNQKLGCTTIKDMMDHFTRVVERSGQQPKVVAYFTHSTTLQLMATALGLNQDSVPLTADNYHTTAVQKRAWRTSNMDPFAANIAAVLYRCDTGEQHQVMFFHNEQPVIMDGCSVGLCSWAWLRARFGGTCDLGWCQKSASIRQEHSTLFVAIFSVLTLGTSFVLQK